jgi:hypothetical protein
MLPPIKPEDLYHATISEGLIPSDFDCGNDDLNDFLLTDAINYNDARVAITFLVFYFGIPIAYYSVGMDCIKLKSRESKAIVKEHHLVRKYSEYPAIKIYRLGVCSEYKKRDAGSNIVLFVLGYVVRDLQPLVGVRFVSVDALEKSVGFYERLAFKVNRHPDERVIRRHEKSCTARALHRLRLKVIHEKTVSMRLDTAKSHSALAAKS